MLVACLALGAGIATAGERARAASACAANLANRLASTGAARQLVTVVSPASSSTRGTLQLWRRSGGCWLPVGGPWSAWLGEHGMSDRHVEGDGTTPTGSFGFEPTMYGLAADPGVHYAYHRIACGDWWVEDPASPSYNRFRHVPCGSTPPFRVKSEDMSRSPTAYRHLAVIAYNTDPVVPGRGSGIFLHVSRNRPTLGCVSLPLPQLLTVLRWLRPEAQPAIVIGTRAEIERF